MRGFLRVATNEQGFVQVLNLKIVCPQPLLIEKLNLKITTKSQIYNVQLDMPPNRVTDVEVNNVQQHLHKTPCW
jgi:hypothetical protein